VKLEICYLVYNLLKACENVDPNCHIGPNKSAREGIEPDEFSSGLLKFIDPIKASFLQSGGVPSEERVVHSREGRGDHKQDSVRTRLETAIVSRKLVLRHPPALTSPHRPRQNISRVLHSMPPDRRRFSM